MRIRSAHVTHTGLLRENNEDAFLDVPGLYAVSDGMGGHAAGEVASALAIEALQNGLTSSPFHMDRTFKAANRRILDAMKERNGCGGMGTTMTALAFPASGRAIVGHVGDSRLYLVRGGVGRQLTKDHTVGAEIERATGKPADPDWKYALANCLGNRLGAHMLTDVEEIAVRTDDLFVLCTDGLGDYMEADDVAAVCAEMPTDPGTIANELVQRALEAGGRDNVTVVVVEVGT